MATPSKLSQMLLSHAKYMGGAQGPRFEPEKERSIYVIIFLSNSKKVKNNNNNNNHHHH